MSKSLVEKIKQVLKQAEEDLHSYNFNHDEKLFKEGKIATLNWVLKIFEEETKKFPNLTDALAERVHIQWAGWTSYMLANMTPENIQRWKRQIKTRYDKLPQKEQETDYALAQQFIPIILRYSKLVPKQKLRELADLLKNLKDWLNQKCAEIYRAEDEDPCLSYEIDLLSSIIKLEVFEKKFAELGLDTKKEK